MSEPPVPAADPGRYEVRPGVVPLDAVDAALRRLHIDLLERGAAAAELSDWLWSVNWFPHLRDDPAICALADALPEDWQVGERCETQILLQFPHIGPEPEITFHQDQEPHWAGDRRYLRIVGVPLSPWHGDNGGLIVRQGETVTPLRLAPGDAVMMSPDLWHSGGINRTGAIRYGVYFRWLDPTA